MASWDNARFDFKPDFTLDSKIKDATTTANKNRYAFDQQKALNRAWSKALDLSNRGRPSEINFLRFAKEAELGPEAADTYRKWLSTAFSTGAGLAGDAMGMTSMGGSPSTILGDAPTPTVTETPAVGGPAGDWLRPSAQPQAPANPAPPVPANETRRTDEENEVHVKPEQGIAPTGGVFQLPAPVEPERTYSAPPQEGVFTQYARGLDPVGAMAQAQDQAMAGVGGASAQAGPVLSPENMNPLQREYTHRALSQRGIRGASLEEQMANIEKMAEKTVRGIAPLDLRASQVGGRYDSAAAAKETLRFREDVLRHNAEKAAAVQKLTGDLLGDFGTVQGTTIAKANADASLYAAATPREGINTRTQKINEDLGTSFDPRKIASAKDPSEVLDLIRLQKNVADRTKSLEVIRGPDGSINGRATLSQIVPLLVDMAKLEGLSGTEGTITMMTRLLAPSMDLGTMQAMGYFDKAQGITDKGSAFILSRLSDIPIEQVRKLATHMAEASPGMAGIYQNYQSDNPQALPVASMDAGGAPAPARDPLASFLRPSAEQSTEPASPVAPKPAPDIRKPSKPLPKAGAISQSGQFFDGKNWRAPKPGDEDRKGRTWTGKRWI